MNCKLEVLAMFVISLTVACNQSESAETGIAKSSDTSIIINRDTISASNDSIGSDIAYFPESEDSVYPYRIITTGTFHGDEVWDNAEEEQWTGLFKGESRYYMAATPVTIKTVYDAVLDEDSTKGLTGKEIITENADTCLFLISGASDMFKEQNVEQLPLSIEMIRPGESFSIRFKGIDYVLSATGNTNDTQNGEGYIKNYSLYLTAVKNGKSIKQLLASSPGFDDVMFTFLFAGDIDGDGILDLLIDTSNHYNVMRPTLYLSKPADSGQLLKVAGMHVSVGC